MDLDNFSLLWLELHLSPLAGFLVEVTLYFDGLCTLHYTRHFPPIPLLHQFHAVSFQILILDSLSSGLLFLFIQVGFSLEYSPSVFLVLDKFLLLYLPILLFLRFRIYACRAIIFYSLWEGAFHSPYNFKILNLLSTESMRDVGFRSGQSS